MPPQIFFHTRIHKFFSIPIPTKFFHTHTHKILPCSWNKTYTCQKIVHINHEFVQLSLHNKFFTTSMPQNSFNNKSPTLPKFTTHQHCPSYTMDKTNTTIQKCPKAKITTWSIMQMPQISTRAHNNTMTMSQHQTLNSKFQIFNPKFQTPNSKSRTSNSKFQTSKIKSFSRNYRNQSKFSW